MKYLFTPFLLLFIFALQAQPVAVCEDNIRIALNPLGEARIFPETIDDGSFAYDELSIDRDFFTCADIGQTIQVTLTATDNNAGESSTCITTVMVEDKLAPVAICDIDGDLILNSDGTYNLTAEEIDDGSYDNCSDITLSVSPSNFTCADVGSTINVTLTVRDQGGNTASCISQLTIRSSIENDQALACNLNTTVQVTPNQSVILYPADILDGGPFSCNESYSLSLEDEFENLIPNNEITSAYVGQTLTATVTNLSNSNSCWGEVVVEGIGECDIPLNICDTQCRSTPIGDCDSGHTDSDQVEWPCDVSFQECLNDVASYTPDDLVTLYGVNFSDSRPQLFLVDCQVIGQAYEDEEFTTGDSAKINRTWTIVDWITGSTYEYVQTIYITPEYNFICDTEAWDTPASDCDSGHTLDDAVEWPADISYVGCDPSPDGLRNDDNTNPFNVEPRFFGGCAFALAYEDVVFVETDSTGHIEREWTAIYWPAATQHTYTQRIDYNAGDCNTKICVNSPTGNPISEVEAVETAAFNTDDDGCDATPTGLSFITPRKLDNNHEGIDALDLILLTNHVLGINFLTGDAFDAADMDEDGMITTLDLVLLQQIFLIPDNNLSYDHWIFRDNYGNKGRLPILAGAFGNQYVGYKKGDLNFSYYSDQEEGLVDGTVGVYAKDDILNRGMDYSLDINLLDRQTLAGISMQLEIDREAVDNIEISSSLAGFDQDLHTRWEDNILHINFILDQDELKAGGISLAQEETVFTINYHALENTLHSLVTRFVDEDESLFVEPSATSRNRLRFEWEDQLILNSEVVTHSASISVFPNPVENYIRVAIDQNVQLQSYTIIDFNGRVISTGNMPDNNQRILAPENAGLYIINLTDKEGTRYVTRFTKQ